MTSQPIKDKQTVRSDGTRIAQYIDGVVLRPLTSHTDDRGSLTELYSQSWDIHPDPMVFGYAVEAAPGSERGWLVHKKQDDRLAFMFGTAKVVLYDDRTSSPTHGMINEFYFNEYRRTLLIIPKGVYHAVKNVGSVTMFFVNFPTRPYNHNDPDKFRLPLNNDLIPYTWS